MRRRVLRRRPVPEPEATEGPGRRTFRDPHIQARFEADGFVVVDVLSDEHLAAVRAGYQALDHGHHRDSPFAAGFNTTMYDDRTAYRASVFDLLAAHVEPALEPILDRHELYVANFAVKLPHADSVPFHLDWSFVDERDFISVGVWIAIFDTDETNGTLGMIRASHRSVHDVRPVNDREYRQYAPDVPGQVLCPLAAGQAVIYDSRTVHFSPPNDSASERVAAACGAAPSEAPLVHYWIDPEDRLQEFEVTREFYLDYVVGASPATAGGVVGVRPRPSSSIQR